MAKRTISTRGQPWLLPEWLGQVVCRASCVVRRVCIQTSELLGNPCAAEHSPFFFPKELFTASLFVLADVMEIVKTPATGP